MTKRTLTSRLIVGVGLLLACAGPAQAATDGDVVRFKQPYVLGDSTRIVVQGTPVRAAEERARPDCRLPRASLSLAPRERAIELRQLSLNLRTCRATFERGVPPKSVDTSVQKPQSSGQQQGDGAGSSGVSALADGYTWSGYSKAWYRDARTNRVVSAVRTGADWNTRGACVGANNVWYRTFADTTTGWFEVSRKWTYYNSTCEYVISSMDAHYRDRNFTGCSGGPTVNSYYSRVRFVGYPNGGLKGSRTSWNEPSCKDVLIAHFALYRR